MKATSVGKCRWSSEEKEVFEAKKAVDEKGEAAENEEQLRMYTVKTTISEWKTFRANT